MDALELAKIQRNAVRREQYRLDGGKRKTENKAWKDAHRDQVRAAAREYAKQYKLANPERVKESNKRARLKRRDAINVSTRDWFKNHPGYSNTKAAEYRRKDPVRFMLRNAKNRAKELGLEFSLADTDIVVPEMCPVLGIKLEFGHGKGRGVFNSPSLDRLDNTKGYTPGNVYVISWRANMLKKDATLAELKQLVAYVERHS